MMFFLGDGCPQVWLTFSFLACTDHLKKGKWGKVEGRGWDRRLKRLAQDNPAGGLRWINMWAWISWSHTLIAHCLVVKVEILTLLLFHTPGESLNCLQVLPCGEGVCFFKKIKSFERSFFFVFFSTLMWKGNIYEIPVSWGGKLLLSLL